MFTKAKKASFLRRLLLLSRLVDGKLICSIAARTACAELCRRQSSSEGSFFRCVCFTRVQGRQRRAATRLANRTRPAWAVAEFLRLVTVVSVAWQPQRSPHCRLLTAYRSPLRSAGRRHRGLLTVCSAAFADVSRRWVRGPELPEQRSRRFRPARSA